VITRCHAKVNLRLRVFGRDDTGFHGVETILLRTDLADTLSIEEAGEGISITVEGEAAGEVPASPDNLCVRAADRFLAEAFAGKRTRPGLRLSLVKRIPAGSGLGGGSADAAGTLRLLSGRWPALPERNLFRIAGKIGSDVPFGLLDVPMALGWERGRRLLPLRPPPERPGLLLSPPFSVATLDAYEWLAASRTDEDPGGASILPGATRLAGWDALERLVRNDLEMPVLERHPSLANARSILQDSGATTSMTGSGSSLFAVFEDAADRMAALQVLIDSGFDADAGWTTHEVRLPV